MASKNSWDEVCIACDLPLTPAIEEIENEAKATGFSTAWLGKNLGFDINNDIVYNLGAYSDHGTIPFDAAQNSARADQLIKALKDSKPDVFAFKTGEMLEDEPGLKGLVMHRSCARLLSNEIGRPLKPIDSLLIWSTHRCKSEYLNTYFMWDELIDEKGISILQTPEMNKDNYRVFRICNNYFIKNASKFPQRNIPKNTQDLIIADTIKTGNIMANFHEESKYGRYYLLSTVKSLKHSPKENAINPETRKKITAKNIIPYVAVVKGGRRTRKQNTKTRRSRK